MGAIALAFVAVVVLLTSGHFADAEQLYYDAEFEVLEEQEIPTEIPDTEAEEVSEVLTFDPEEMPPDFNPEMPAETPAVEQPVSKEASAEKSGSVAPDAKAMASNIYHSNFDDVLREL